MAADELVISAGPGERRIAVLARGRILEIHVARSGDLVGGVWLGRVVEVNRGVKAAFVDLGTGRPGFLPGLDHEVGDPVLVQATAEPREGKGCMLSGAPSLPGRLLAFAPFRPGIAVSRRLPLPERRRLEEILTALVRPGEGLVARSAAAGQPAETLAAEAEALRRRWEDLAARAKAARWPALLLPPDPLARLLTDHPGVVRILADDDLAFVEARRFGIAERRPGVMALTGFDDVLAAALEPTAPLPGGGRLTFERTAALIAIDVDGAGRPPAEANLAAAGEVAAQIRLRGLSGHLVLDAIPERGRGGQDRLLDALRRAVANDPTPTHVVGTSPLGLVEMTRERRRAALDEVLLEPAARRPTPETVALAALREVDRRGRAVIAAAPEVTEALARMPARAEAEARLGRRLALVPQPGRQRQDWEVRDS